jgi:Arc/MetJ family transcription regulator
MGRAAVRAWLDEPRRSDAPGNGSVMHIGRHQMMLLLMHPFLEAFVMRTTVNLDDALLAEARRLTRIEERTALLHEALRALIARESARRLARLGGSEPQLRPVPRRRSARR